MRSKDATGPIVGSAPQQKLAFKLHTYCLRQCSPECPPNRTMLNPRAFTFGGTSAIVTSMGLVIGLQSATAPPPTIVSGLLVIALADNISDSLSIHMYQEAERLDGKGALRTTLADFVSRLLVALSFVFIVITV